MKKEYYYYGFLGLLLVFLAIFLIDTIFGKSIFGFEGFLSQNNFQDYFADFFNQVKLTHDTNVYDGPEFTLAERALPPVQYVLLRWIGKIFNYSSVPTLFLNGYSFPVEISKPLYLSTYFMCSVSILLFICLYENLKNDNRYLKLLAIILLIFSYPFMFEFQRGNILLVAILGLTYYLFNYNSENKYVRFLSLFALSIAIAFKPLPLLFLSLLLFNKRYKDILKVLLMSLIITLLSFLCLKGGLHNIPLYIRNMGYHQHVYNYASNNMIIWFIILYLLSFLTKTDWKRCFIICLLIIICVPRGYNLLYLLPVTVMFLNQQNFCKKDILYGIMLVLLISPLHLINDIYLCYACGLVITFDLIYEQIIHYINKKRKTDG